MKIPIAALLLTRCTLSSAQEIVATFDVGGTEVKLMAHHSDKPGLLYFNMHDNENTSVNAARKVVSKNGGTLYELVHSGGRYIEFPNGDTLVRIDPNRIYTEAGVWRELDRNGITDTAVFDMVRGFGRCLIDTMKLDSQELIIALHNNSNHNYSYHSYTSGGEYEKDAIATHRGRKRDEDAFYFITSDDYFQPLQGTCYHIVLQDNRFVTDDGSLSVYCGQKGIDYINVEAQHNRKCRNRKMIKQMLRELGKAN